MRKLKLIWDFKGPNAEKTARHHEIHLNEYTQTQSKPVTSVGHQRLNELHTIAFMVINEEDKILFRDQLKPHRGEWVE